MKQAFEEYTISSADWRKTLRQNSSRTYIVIGIFIAIYASIGLIVDMYLYADMYAPYAPPPLSTLFFSLITFQLFPIATIIMLAIATISLFVSFLLHDKLMLLGTTYHEITPETARSTAESQLYNVVNEMKIAAGLHYMPKVYLIEADYMNAFASGYSERSAMVAITRGLLEKLNRDELQAVMAHELSHIRHLDIKLTLTASLLSNLTIMVLDIFFHNMLYGNRRNDNRSRQSLGFIIVILRFLLPIISVLLIFYLSRTRELMADAGAVQLTRNNQPLASALLKIHHDHMQFQDKYKNAYEQTAHENVRKQAYLYDPSYAGIQSLTSLNDFFSTHPSLETRLQALGFKKR